MNGSVVGFGESQVGQVYGSRKITAYNGIVNQSRRYSYQCIDCGRESRSPTTLQHIRREQTCQGCYKKEKHGMWRGHEGISGSFLGYYQADAKRKGRVWDVTPEYLWSVWQAQGGRCALTAIELTHGKDASIDRINSSLGYTPGNVQWVHRDVNRMKSDFDQDYFIEICKKIANSI